MTVNPVALVGLGLVIGGGVWFLVVAFSKSIWWGLGCLLCSPVGLVFLVLNFGRAWKPFALEVVGVALYVAGGGAYGQVYTLPPG